MKKTALRRLVAYLLLISLIPAIAVALASKFKASAEISKKKPPLLPAIRHAEYDTVLLKSFKQVLQGFNLSKNTYTLSGRINVVNQADSSENMRNEYFLLCKQGETFYYRQGMSEMLNSDDKYLEINTATKNVFLSVKKSVSPEIIIDSAKLLKALLSENYLLTSSANQGKQTILLTNETHWYCKQYAITFDTSQTRVTGLRLRLSATPGSTEQRKEKIINITIDRFDTEANVDKYKKVSEIINNKNELSGKYAAYKLIQLN